MHKTQYLLITLLLVWSCGGDPVEQANFPYVYEYEGTGRRHSVRPAGLPFSVFMKAWAAKVLW